MSKEFYEKAQAYNAAVVGVGYAGIFALLSYTHADMSEHARAWAAICLLFSLAVFVLWVVGQMIADTMGWCDSMPVKGRLFAWVTALALTILPALAAAVIMFQAYFAIIVSAKP